MRLSFLPATFGSRIMRFAPLLALLVFGSWAAFVNREYGLFVLLRSGLGQGSYAFVSTWVVSRVAENVYSYAGGKLQGFIAGFVASFLIMVCMPLAIHFILGTPEVLAAILPGIVWGSGYIVSYLWILSKQAT